MATFLEGVESITLLCSLVVLLPTVVLVLVAPTGRGWLAGAATVGTATMMWARAGRIWNETADGAARWVVGAVVIATFVIAYRHRYPPPVASVALGLGAGAIAGWMWQPCVGEHFAEILNRAESDRIVALAEMQFYVIGLLIPAIVAAALPHALPRLRPTLHADALRRVALITAIAYGAAVAVGWYDDLVSELFRISSRSQDR